MVSKKELNKLLNKKKVALVFLGVGTILFLLNVSSFLSFLPNDYSFLAFDLAVFSSMILIVFSVWILYHDSK